MTGTRCNHPHFYPVTFNAKTDDRKNMRVTFGAPAVIFE